MSQDVIPSHMSGASYYDGGAFGNMRLRPGEIQAAYPPKDPKNVSQKYWEYDVLVQHRSGGTATSKMYNHVYATDPFGGIADTFTWTFRADKSAYRKPLKAGLGSKVLLLCINGENNNAVIMGGYRDMGGEVDDADLGHHLKWRFHGIEATINKDGELIIERQGPQNADGSLLDGVDEKTTGSTVSFLKNGNIEIADAVRDANGDVQAKNLVTIDHDQGKITITGDAQVNVNGPKVTLSADDATEPFVLGNSWVSIMSDLIDAIDQISVPTAVGPSGPPINAPQFLEIRARLQSILSQTTFSK